MCAADSSSCYATQRHTASVGSRRRRGSHRLSAWSAQTMRSESWSALKAAPKALGKLLGVSATRISRLRLYEAFLGTRRLGGREVADIELATCPILSLYAGNCHRVFRAVGATGDASNGSAIESSPHLNGLIIVVRLSIESPATGGISIPILFTAAA